MKNTMRRVWREIMSIVIIPVALGFLIAAVFVAAEKLNPNNAAMQDFRCWVSIPDQKASNCKKSLQRKQHAQARKRRLERANNEKMEKLSK